jgi:DNA-binding response OmpR family regulator
MGMGTAMNVDSGMASAQSTKETGACVLIVDDDEGGRYAKSRILKQAGFHVLEAKTAAACFQHLQQEHPQLVCLDVHLPDMNGFEVCKKIKADPLTSSTVILQMSATFVEHEDQIRGLEGGADSYLTEPFDPGVFLAIVRALLRLHDSERLVRLSAQQWRATFDTITEGIALLDEQQRIVRCNEALRRVFDRPFNEILGRSLSELQEGLLQEMSITALREMLASAQSREVLISMAGQWFRAKLSRVGDDLLLGYGFVYVLTDVSEWKHTVEERDKLIADLKQSGGALEEKVRILEQFEDAVVGRELKMIALEKEVAKLKEKLNRSI